MILSLLIAYFIYAVYIILLPMLAAYRFPFFVAFKNSVLLTIYYPVTTIIVSLPLIAIVLIMALGSTFLAALAYMVLLMFGFGYLGLMWTVYAHYVFDNTINVMVKGGVKGKLGKRNSAKGNNQNKQNPPKANAKNKQKGENYSANYKKMRREKMEAEQENAEINNSDDGIIRTESENIEVVSSKKNKK